MNFGISSVGTLFLTRQFSMTLSEQHEPSGRQVTKQVSYNDVSRDLSYHHIIKQLGPGQ